MPSSAVFDKYKAGKLHSGSKQGPPVTNHKQAVAIFLSEKRAEQKHGGKYPEKRVNKLQRAGSISPRAKQRMKFASAGREDADRIDGATA